MARATTSSAETRRKLLEAATELFAESGYRAVSIRDVSKASGVNSALINYHFGSKDGLFVEVVRLASANHVAERMHLLSMAKASGQALTINDILLIYLDPLLGKQNNEGYHGNFSRLHSWMVSERAEIGDDMAVRAFNTVNSAFIDELGLCLPHLTREVVIWRFYMMIGSLLFMNIRPSPPGLMSISGGRCDATDSRELLRQLMPSLTASFLAPMPD